MGRASLMERQDYICALICESVYFAFCERKSYSLYHSRAPIPMSCEPQDMPQVLQTTLCS